MSNPNPLANEETVFSAVIVPHRSLSPLGFRVLMGFIILAITLTSIPFFIIGAWPIIGFLGLDLVLIYAAFRYNNATARAYEEIFLSRIQLLFRSVNWRGRVKQEACFNPLWTRIERDEDPDFGTEKVEIVQGRSRIEVARALGREERGAFADAFQKALATAKR